jgi:hypothetical protein
MLTGRLLFVVLALLMVSCSRFLDAIVTNACDVPIEVAFWGGDDPPSGSEAEDLPRHLIAGHTTAIFHDAIAAPEGNDGGLLIVWPENSPTIATVPFPAGDSEPVPVGVAPTVCE